MNTGWLSQVAVHLVQGWVSCYTRGLPAAVCEARRQEIDSDLWEHQRHGAVYDRAPTETAMEVLARLLMGIPADLIWRWEMGRWAQQAQRVEETPAAAGESREKKWRTQPANKLALRSGSW